MRLYARAVEVLVGGEHKGRSLTPEARAQLALDMERLDRVSLILQRTGAETYASEVLERAVAETRPAEVGGDDTSELIERVAVRSGLLARHDGAAGPWRYLHRSIREFLAARAMARLEDPARGIAFPQPSEDSKADAKAWETSSGTWGEPLALLCGLLGATKPDQVSALLGRVAEQASEVAQRALLNADGLEPPVATRAFCEAPFHLDGEALLELVRLHARRGPRYAEAVKQALYDEVKRRPAIARLAVLHWALTWVNLEGREPSHAEDLRRAEPDRAHLFRLAGRPEPPARAEDVGLTFSPVIGGQFTMGSPGGVGHGGEHPAHEVTVAPFQAGLFTVTAGEFRRLARSPEEWASRWPTDLHPAANATWYMARLFAAWVGARLPTEAEWELACRGGTQTDYSSGDGRRGSRKSVGTPATRGARPTSSVRSPPTPSACTTPTAMSASGAPTGGEPMARSPSGIRAAL